MRSAFALSWNVQWLGSFPVSATDPESVSQRLDRFATKQPPVLVQLSVSVAGVKVCTSLEKRPLLSHSLRRVSCVVGRTERCQVAYIAREPSGETYRRLCHLFRTESPHQVEEIESVLGNAFQAAAMSRAAPTPVLPPKPSVKLVHSETPYTPTSTAPSTPLAYTPAGDTVKSRAPICSTAFLQRLFGSKSRADSELFNKENPAPKRRRRPVSAVFSQALHRLSSTSIYNKRFSSVDTPAKHRPTSIAQPSSCEHSERQSTAPKKIDETPTRPSRLIESTPSLHFDERLSEWVYPIDDALARQLDQVAYFCKDAHRSRVLKALLAQPEGSFVLRFSESKKKCLALSVRVPFTHNPTGVSHYLIIRNENGFRIKGFSKYFPSIPMLVTHHSVMPEQLPCRLVFAHWDRTWKCEDNNNYDYPPFEEFECPDNGAR